jgi:hypothetical protein
MTKRELKPGDIVRDGSDQRLRGRVLKTEFQAPVPGRGIVEQIYVDWMVGSDQHQ